jgi:hypothetical protein
VFIRGPYLFGSLAHHYPESMPVYKKDLWGHGWTQIDTDKKTSSLWSSAAHIFFGSFISDSSMTGAGPEMPPSLRTRQKCTTMNAEAIIGIATQCQM